jgi:23S rRNA pseudouridine1911/1915/1917 synthase
MFRSEGDKIQKRYRALVEKCPEPAEGELVHYLLRNEKQNKSYAYPQPRNGAKESRLRYRLVHPTINYFLVEVELLTGRHHQIRCQLSTIGSVIKGDLKYGARRSNRDGGISLHAYSVSFIHPVKKERVEVIAHHPLYE